MQLRSYLTRLGELTGHPAAFGIVLVYAVAWAVFEPGGLDWHGVATLATWSMTLFIQRSEYRDTLAVHAKLDELLRVNHDARNELTNIDDQDLEDVRHYRDRERDAKR